MEQVTTLLCFHATAGRKGQSGQAAQHQNPGTGFGCGARRVELNLRIVGSPSRIQRIVINEAAWIVILPNGRSRLTQAEIQAVVRPILARRVRAVSLRIKSQGVDQIIRNSEAGEVEVYRCLVPVVASAVTGLPR